MGSSIAFIAAAVICAVLLLYLPGVAKSVGLVDRPNYRKRHSGDIPLVGGIGMVIALMLSVLLLPMSLANYRLLFFSIGIIFIVGVLDDHQDLPPWVKFATQIMVAWLLVTIDQKVVYFIGDIFASAGWGQYRSQGLGPVAEGLTIFAIVGVVNAFNFVDGHDGLAGSLAVIAFLGLFILCDAAEKNAQGTLIGLMVVVLGVFLIFNLPLTQNRKYQVYMGDSGSMFIGVVLAYFLIDLSQVGFPVERVNPGKYPIGHPVIKPSAVPWLIAIPLMDTINVISRRVKNGISPLTADRRHVHHCLSRAGLSKMQVLLVLATCQIGFVSTAVIGTMFEWPDWILFWGIILAFVVFSCLVSWVDKPDKLADGI